MARKRKKKPSVPPIKRKRWTLENLRSLTPEDFAFNGELMKSNAALARIASAANRQLKKAEREFTAAGKVSPAIEHFRATTVTRLDKIKSAKDIEQMLESGEMTRRGLLHDILAHQNLFSAQTFTVEGATEYENQMSMRILGFENAPINWKDFWKVYDAFIDSYAHWIPFIVGGTNTVQTDIARYFLLSPNPITTDSIAALAKDMSKKYNLRFPGETNEAFLDRIFYRKQEPIGSLGSSDSLMALYSDEWEETMDDDFPF